MMIAPFLEQVLYLLFLKNNQVEIISILKGIFGGGKLWSPSQVMLILMVWDHTFRTSALKPSRTPWNLRETSKVGFQGPA